MCLGGGGGGVKLLITNLVWHGKWTGQLYDIDRGWAKQNFRFPKGPLLKNPKISLYPIFLCKNHSINLKKNFAENNLFCKILGHFCALPWLFFRLFFSSSTAIEKLPIELLRNKVNLLATFYENNEISLGFGTRGIPGKIIRLRGKNTSWFYILHYRSRGFRTTCFQTRIKKNIQPLHRRYKTNPWSIGENISKTFKRSTDRD
jgi:hypothetical protein